MRTYLRTGKGIKVATDHGDGEIICTYRLKGKPRMFRIRLGPAHFVDLPRKELDLTETVIKFATIKKLFTETSPW